MSLRENLFLPPIPCPGCITLQNLAAKVVQENFKEVAFQEEFLSLSLDQVVPYIASDQIDIDCEKDVFDVSDRFFRGTYVTRSAPIPVGILTPLAPNPNELELEKRPDESL